jgi:hypothetical protein
VVHKVVEPPDTPPVQRPPLACDAQYWHGLPEAAPPPGEHAGLHGLRRRQERQHVLQDLIWQTVDPIASTCLRHRLPLSRDRYLVLHYVEQLGSAGAENWMKNRSQQRSDMEHMVPRTETHELSKKRRIMNSWIIETNGTNQLDRSVAQTNCIDQLQQTNCIDQLHRPIA